MSKAETGAFGEKNGLRKRLWESELQSKDKMATN